MQLSFLILLALICSQALSYTFKLNISIQNTSQIFNYYVPYVSVCNYQQQPNIIPGENQTTILTSQRIFQQNYQNNQFTYWLPVKNGLYMYYNNDDLIAGYDGAVIYNSLINSNFTRKLILYTLVNGQLTFYYSLPYLNSTDSIANNIVQTNLLSFPSNVSQILGNCTSNRLLITYIGYSQFLGICKDIQVFFYWKQNNQSYAIAQSFNQPQLFDSIANITSAPQLYADQLTHQELPWRFTMLSARNSLFACNLSTMITCLAYQQISIETQVLINKLWGYSYEGQYLKLQDSITIIQKFKREGFYIPGEIESIYIDHFGMIYFQSYDAQSSYSYLIEFDSDGLLVINSTFIGNIYGYNVDQILIKSVNGPFYISKFVLPIFQLTESYYPKKQYSFSLSCTTGFQLNFDLRIMWTSIHFPKGTVNPIIGPPTVTNSQIFSYFIENYFQVIGPDYSIYISTYSNSLQGVIIDSQSLAVDDYIYSLARVIFASETKSNSKNVVPRSFYYTAQSAIKYYDIVTNTSVTVVRKPCGLVGPLYSQIILNTIIIYGQNKSQGFCQCNVNLKNCVTINQSEYLRLKYSIMNNSHFPISNSSEQKYIIGQLSKQGLLVTIYRNNSIILSQISTNQTLSIVTIDNCTYNSVLGEVFFNYFQYPIFVAFCEYGTLLYQFNIINDTLIWGRNIPVYGFQTRNTTFFRGTNFAFLQVDPLTQYMNYQKCCVLRLSFDDFTVGVIEQVVAAKFVTFIYSLTGIDIAVYNDSDVTSLPQFVKIYFQSSFLALNQSSITDALETYSYSVVFESSYYNFGSAYSFNVTFNLSSAVITYLGTDTPTIILDAQNFQIFGQNIYRGSSAFSYTQFCGPIMNTQFNYLSPANEIDKIYSESGLIENSVIGSEGQDYIQIVTCQETYALFNVDSTISTLLILVGVDTLFVYEKMDNASDIVPVINISTQYKSTQYQYCMYYIYKYINSTAVQFISDCISPQLQVSQPLLTLNYQNSIPTYSLSEVIQTTNLRNVVVIPGLMVNNIDVVQPYIIGIMEGPMGSLTGKLLFCAQIDQCSTLYVSSQNLYLISFAVLPFTSTLNGAKVTSFAIMALDNKQISIWIGLSQVQPINILPNYTINYSTSINQIASVINIVNCTFTNATVIIATDEAYVQLSLDYSNLASKITRKFLRYTNCQPFDQFPPEIVYDINGNFQTLITQCNQNQAIIKLQSLQIIDTTTSPIIYTGYIQLYNLYGPQCSPNVYSPINILPISSLMDFKMFKRFYQGGKSYRLIYEQIKGILFDSNIYDQPYIYLEIVPLKEVLIYPSITLQISNQYFSTNVSINIADKKTTLNTIGYIAISLISVFNLITLLFILYWLFFIARKVFIRVKARVVREQIEPSELDYIDDNKYKRQDSQISAKNRVSQIELYEMKSVPQKSVI